MNPPPAEGLASRLFLGPALRTQPDRRLVTLVRDGYDTAFEEIVRRYGKTLTRYAASIVGGRSEDVTQDAFSKALLALRRDSGAEIDLRPWLYRIVRNTALNDLRDRPPDAAELTEALGAGSRSAAEEAERREEIAELMRRLRDLPEQQRAAIVMRELEGLGHEEIASALGLSGGGARQAIYRARQALRDGLGLLIPLPLLRVLTEHGADATAGAAAAGAGGAAAAMGGAGAGTALKVGVVTAVLAGSVGTGLAINENRAHDPAVEAETAAAATLAGGGGGEARGAPSATGPDSTPAAAGSEADEGHGGEDRGSGGLDENRSEAVGVDDSSGPGPARHQEPGDDGHRGSGNPGPGGGGGHSGPGPSQEVSGHGGSGSGGGGSGSGDGGIDSSGSGSSDGGSGSSGSGSVSSGSDSSSSGPGPGGSLLPPPEGDSSGSGSGSSGSGSGSGSSGPGGGDLLDDGSM
jgi:RNA polymerase sigma factor (sigma-70 family)